MKKFIIPFISLLMLVVGCTSNSENTLQPKYDLSTVTGVWEVVDHDGRMISTDLRDVSTEKGRISGLGFFQSGTTTRILVRPNSGYTYKGMYFRYDSGYSEDTYPTTVATAYKRPIKDITVRGNITVVAIIEKGDGSAIVDVD